DGLRGVAIQNSVHLNILESSCPPTQENSRIKPDSYINTLAILCFVGLNDSATHLRIKAFFNVDKVLFVQCLP
ncbi:MAG: hypothetical protein ACKPEQ_41355, partial [Dolichospermum sp.]